jgi:PPIC-type peptidyl-prolyl cis-trans isomerase-like protein
MFGSLLRIATLAAALVGLTTSLSAQDGKRGDQPPVLIPPGQGGSSETPPPAPGHQGRPVDDEVEQALRDQSAQQRLAMQDAKQPRGLSAGLKLPYTSNRKLIEVNASSITTAELNQFFAYYQSFRPGPADLLLRDAVKALLPMKIVAEKYSDDLPAMRARIDEALNKVRNGAEWSNVVAEYSDDSEAENPEGKYVFGRERAVQPFDRVAHSGRVGQIHGPFLTVYGYHFLEILDYQRGATGADDETTVRHVLVMYPDLKKRDAAGDDIRAYIKALLASAKIKVLERGSEALLGPPASK